MALDASDRVTPMTEKGIPMGQLSGSDATDRLRTVIEENQKVTERQTTTMIQLTWVMAALTVITTVLTVVTAAPIVVQIWHAVRSWVFWQAVRVWFSW
jgi:hypothetical protein